MLMFCPKTSVIKGECIVIYPGPTFRPAWTLDSSEHTWTREHGKYGGFSENFGLGSGASLSSFSWLILPFPYLGTGIYLLVHQSNLRPLMVSLWCIPRPMPSTLWLWSKSFIPEGLHCTKNWPSQASSSSMALVLFQILPGRNLHSKMMETWSRDREFLGFETYCIKTSQMPDYYSSTMIPRFTTMLRRRICKT